MWLSARAAVEEGWEEDGKGAESEKYDPGQGNLLSVRKN